MSMKDHQLTVLVELAQLDGEVSPKERDLIIGIGQANGISLKETEDIISSPGDPIDPQTMTNDEKFECLYNIVHLIKVNGKIFDKEVDYCMNMARRLGYPLEAVLELYKVIHANVSIAGTKSKLKRKFNGYLEERAGARH